MTWPRAQYMDLTRAQMDARGSADWQDQDIRIALGLAHTRAWKQVLDANLMYRAQSITVAQDLNGRIPLASLDTGAADSQQRFYRIIIISNGIRVYAEDQFKRLPLATITGFLNIAPTWYPMDAFLQCLPAEPSASMLVTVNHTPTPMDQLSADTVAAEFPRDYENLLVYDAAAMLLSKGGRETGATADLLRLADMIRAELLGDVVRTSTDPTQMGFPDTRGMWAGEGWG